MTGNCQKMPPVKQAFEREFGRFPVTPGGVGANVRTSQHLNKAHKVETRVARWTAIDYGAGMAVTGEERQIAQDRYPHAAGVMA
jgi:hypothetical protein